MCVLRYSNQMCGERFDWLYSFVVNGTAFQDVCSKRGTSCVAVWQTFFLKGSGMGEWSKVLQYWNSGFNSQHNSFPPTLLWWNQRKIPTDCTEHEKWTSQNGIYKCTHKQTKPLIVLKAVAQRPQIYLYKCPIRRGTQWVNFRWLLTWLYWDNM